MQPITVPFDAEAIKSQPGQLWDPVRKLWVAHTPEEWVRQLWLQYWIAQGVPANRMQVEKGLQVHGQPRRTDVVVFDQAFRPWLLLECKAPSVQVKQSVFDQIARYNLTLQVPYLVVSNGHFTFAAHIDHQAGSYDMLTALPSIEIQ